MEGARGRALLDGLVGDRPERSRPPWARRDGGSRHRALLLDVAPAALLAAALSLVTALAPDEGTAARPLDLGAYGLCVAAGLGFAARRHAPLLTYVLAVAASAGTAAVYHGGPVFVAAVLSLLWLVPSRPRREWMTLVLAGGLVLGVAHAAGEGVDFGLIAIATIWLGAALLFGEVARSRQAEAAEGRARAELAERQREDETLRRVAEERLRIAREVHDVVGHGLAAISLQAGVAEHLLDVRPEEARKSLAAIRKVSRTALDELRTEIATLRTGPGGEALRHPAPGLQSLPSLVDSLRDAGLDVDLDLSLDGELPPLAQTAGYRIVQEALTNVARHAGPGTHADVRVRVAGGRLAVEVVDDGPGTHGAAPEGNGIVGMRERATALGGHFESGTGPRGGFRVWASLPAEPA